MSAFASSPFLPFTALADERTNSIASYLDFAGMERAKTPSVALSSADSPMMAKALGGGGVKRSLEDILELGDEDADDVLAHEHQAKKRAPSTSAGSVLDDASSTSGESVAAASAVAQTQSWSDAVLELLGGRSLSTGPAAAVASSPTPTLGPSASSTSWHSSAPSPIPVTPPATLINHELFLAAAAVAAPSISNNLKDVMASGALGLSFGLELAITPQMVKTAKSAGYHSLHVDFGSDKPNLQMASEVFYTALNLGITPICVLPTVQPDIISRILDNGAQGIMIRANTADEAADIVRSTKYYPMGQRPPTLKQPRKAQSTHIAKAQQVANEAVLAVPVIDAVQGVNNCEAIAAVPGVDMVFINVSGLSNDLGCSGQYDDPRVYDSLARICRAATKASTPSHPVYVGLSGKACVRPDLISRLRSEFPCVRCALAGRDTSILQSGMEVYVTMLRGVELGMPSPWNMPAVSIDPSLITGGASPNQNQKPKLLSQHTVPSINPNALGTSPLLGRNPL
ncbi:hypothetical protein Q8F55_008863 [Vanrija albida]|uniref:HpcH/HpaI aldolase/citrate lyase domain-containing protein n=1 Tax=Vanrija albida TaxID=181172 RepID=A0ABR3PS10_9TREE